MSECLICCKNESHADHCDMIIGLFHEDTRQLAVSLREIDKLKLFASLSLLTKFCAFSTYFPHFKLFIHSIKLNMDNLPALCPPNITLHDIWINHGVSQCFLDTVSSSIMAGFIFIVGTIQLIIYRRHGTIIDRSRLRSSFLYKMQILLMLVVAHASLIRLYVHFKFFGGIQIYGYMVVNTDMNCKHSIILFRFSDPPYSFHVFRLSLCYVPGDKRTTLSVAFGSCERSRICYHPFLHDDRNRTKSRSYQYQLERLVVRNER